MVLKIKQLDVPKKSVPLGGLYVISPIEPSAKPDLFKIGKSINLKRRLNSYHICFPQGFFIYALLIAKTAKSRPLRIEEIGNLETTLFEIIKTRSDTHHKKYISGAREMFQLSPKDMNEVFTELQKRKGDIIKIIHVDPISSISHIEAKDYSIPDEGKTTAENLAAVKLIDKAVKQTERFIAKHPEKPPTRIQPKRKVRESIKSRYEKIRQKHLDLGVY